MQTLNDAVTNPSGYDSLKNYIGERSFPGWDVVLTHNRDSGELEESNWFVALEELGGESDTVQIYRFGHWACGWWEALCVLQNTPAHHIAECIQGRLEEYPVLDDDDFSQREHEAAERIWADCYTTKERVRYIREHATQFDFAGFADMLGCVRGRYFAGYAAELL